jgi:hypothetical protein
MSQEIFTVESLHQAHTQIRAEDWRSPLARRFLEDDSYRDGEKRITVSFRPTGGPAVECTAICRWRGLRNDFKKCIRTYQVPIITEFATLGIACLVTQHRVGASITEVTRRGEKADYWIGDKEFLLEVSGQQSGNLQVLHEEKAKQLLANPFGKSGYVCVADYSGSRVEYWFHEYEGE